MNRINETQGNNQPARTEPIGWLQAVTSRAGGAVKWVIIGTLCLMLACCAPVAVAGWWANNTIADSVLPRHPAQIIATPITQIECEPDEWIAMWPDASGRTNYACTPQWK